MIYTLFTYKRDAELAISCVEAIRLADPAAKIAIFDDAIDPIQINILADHYERTTFPRQGNLNGLPCIKGMLECMIKASNLFNETEICKIDSDTILVQKPEISTSGFWGSELYFDFTASGACYAMTKEMAINLLNDIEIRPWRNSTHPEDQTISKLAVLRGAVVDSFSQGKLLHINMWQADSYFMAQKASHPNLVAIHMGHIYTDNIDRTNTANRMSEVSKLKTN